MKLKRFLSQNKTIPEFIEGGVYGLIYRISEDHCAKVLHICGDIIQENFVIDNLYHEFKIMKGLYCKKVSVPKPEGIFKIQFPQIGKYPALIMEYINGIKTWKLENRFDELSTLTSRELEKARKFGYVPGEDCGVDSNNVLWSDERKKIVLIDFGNWGEC